VEEFHAAGDERCLVRGIGDLELDGIEALGHSPGVGEGGEVDRRWRGPGDVAEGVVVVQIPLVGGDGFAERGLGCAAVERERLAG